MYNQHFMRLVAFANQLQMNQIYLFSQLLNIRFNLFNVKRDILCVASVITDRAPLPPCGSYV